MILNKQQEQIVSDALKFLKNPNQQVFEYAGYAGTGKSVVLQAILERSGIRKERVAPMAYIGQAAIVMRTKGFTNAKTIHSWLLRPCESYVRDNGNVVMDNYFNRPKTRLDFEIKEPPDVDFMFIDEAGSVPYELKHVIESRGIKIIACGDLGQLPPPCGKPAYLTGDNIQVLDEIMRQSHNSNIVYLADRCRRGLPIHEGFYGDCLVINEDELTNEMIMHSDIIVCGKNATRDYFNNRVRSEIIRTNSVLPVYGEKMVCRKNDWSTEVDGINLANGLIGNVINSPYVDTFDNSTFSIDFKPSMINGYFNKVSCDYKYLIAPHDQKQIIKNDKYSFGQKFEFAYAITTHMSQGGQFNNGIYFEEFLRKDIQNNLNYTGITRFKNFCIYVKKKKKYY